MPKNKGKSNFKGKFGNNHIRKKVLPQKKGGSRVSCPSEYKNAAKALKNVTQNHTNLAYILDVNVCSNRMAYPIALLAVNHKDEIDYLLTRFKILEENQGLSHWDLRALMAEMIWGKQNLKSSASAVEAMKYYEESMREGCLEMNTIFPNSLDSVVPILPVYVRVNKLQMSVEDALQNFYQDGWKLLPPCNTYSEYLHMVGLLEIKQGYFMRDFHIPELLVFPPGVAFYNHGGYLTGRLILQDKGSCLSTFLLNPSPGSTVLDLCAAPGFKTNHLANLMNNNGLLYANDIHPVRFATLSQLLELTNVRCAKLTNNDIFNPEFSTNIPKVDYILVDPSCTYSGIFSKLGTDYQGDRIKRFSWSANAILRFALQSFPNVKRVVYTTCSIFPAEGEKVVDDALKEVGDSFTLVDLKEFMGKGWVNQGITKFEISGQKTEYACGGKCLRSVPQYDLCQGYFIAMFERNFEVPVPPYEKKLFKKKRLESTIEVTIGDVAVAFTAEVKTKNTAADSTSGVDTQNVAVASTLELKTEIVVAASTSGVKTENFADNLTKETDFTSDVY